MIETKKQRISFFLNVAIKEKKVKKYTTCPNVVLLVRKEDPKGNI